MYLSIICWASRMSRKEGEKMKEAIKYWVLGTIGFWVVFYLANLV